MKNAKLILALLAGFSIALIFGFTKDGGVKKARKHVSIVYIDNIYIIKIISATGAVKKVSTKKMERDEIQLEISKIMNELEEQGYELVNTLSTDGIYEYIFREKEAK